jgi:flagellar L-ring protein precursor FlgH
MTYAGRRAWRLAKVFWFFFVKKNRSAFLKKRSKKLLSIGVALSLAGCGALQKLADVGRPPAMTTITDPTADPKWRPVSLPMPHAEIAPSEPASLWRTGSRAFFKDQRAAAVGDIVTVLVNTTDTANVQNASSQTSAASEQMGVPSLLGLGGVLPKLFTSAVQPSNLVSTSSTGVSGGTGTIKRNETVALRLAGVITQVLPNGNLVVAARQEMRVNSELRELTVSGIIRPQDIASDNTVSHDRMAEARISYGGRGQLTTVQTARYGQQVLDILLPF